MKYGENDWVYDIEFYQNLFLMNVRSFPDGERKYTFEISSRKSARANLLRFLETDGLRMFGYNNTGYDYPVLHFLIEHPETSLLRWWNHIQKTIFEAGDDRKPIWAEQRYVPQIDIFKILHLDNPAKSASLKWLEFTQRWHKVQDLPIRPHAEIQEDQIAKLIEYCWNDVDFTFKLFQDNIGAVRFRERMSEKLDKNVMDFSDVKIGEYLNQIGYMKRTGVSWDKLRTMRTRRNVHHLKEIIPDVVEFQTPIMQDWLKSLRKMRFADSKRGEDRDRSMVFDIVINYHNQIEKVVPKGHDEKKVAFQDVLKQLNTVIRFAKGGLHSIDMPRVVDRKEGWILMEKDVGSMYPRGIVVDGIYPQHLGEEWLKGIDQMYHHRLDNLKPAMKKIINEKHKGDYMAAIQDPEYIELDDEQALYKLAMNGGGFGKMGSEYSWQYDPLAKYRVTIGGELKLLMLIEAFVMRGIEIVSVNTDGVVIHYPKEKQVTVDKIHNWWQDTTKFELEDTFYSRIVFSSVNDYLALITDGPEGKLKKVKYKGDFEMDTEIHKNNSQRIVPIALSEYFVNDRPIRDVITGPGAKFTNSEGKEEETTIFDYCIGRKGSRASYYSLVSGREFIDYHDKVIRYYIAKTKTFLLKRYTSGKKGGTNEKVNAGNFVEMFMDYRPPHSVKGYNLELLYYKSEAQRIIDKIEKGTRWLNHGFEEQLKIS